MSPCHRPLLGAVLRGSLPAGLAACCLALAVWRGGNFWSVPRPDGLPDRAAPDGQAAADVCPNLLRRVRDKERLAGEVIEGRLSLAEAAARYRDLDAQPPPPNWEEFRRVYPGASDDERHCRQVIANVRLELPFHPDADPALLGRLEAELDDLLGRGDFHLPGPAAAAAP